TAVFTSSNPNAGSLTVDAFGSTTPTYNAATGDWTVTGSINDANAALAAVAFVPTANFSGDFTVTTRIRDQAGTGPEDGLLSFFGTPENDTPSDLTLSNASINQSAGENGVVGTLSTTDVDVGDTHTYTLVAGEGDDANGSFNISGDSLRANNPANLAAGTYSVRIQTSDGMTAYSEAFAITVVDDLSPTIAMSTISSDDHLNLNDSGSALTISGTTTGVEDGRTVTVTLDGATYTDLVASNAWSVTIPSGVIETMLDGSYTVAADVSDAAGNDALQATRELIVDWTKPAVDSVSVPANGTHAIGDVLTFTVVFAENVYVEGTPSLGLTIGSKSTSAVYESGSGTTSLIFEYTVASGDVDSNGITLESSIAVNGGGITDVAGNGANLLLNSVGSTTAVLVDGIAPTVESIVRHNPMEESPASSSVTYQVTFSEAVTGVDLSDFTLTGDGAGGVLDQLEGVSGGTVYGVTVTGLTGNGALRLDLEASGTGIIDAAGNAQVGGFTAGESYILDLTVSFPIAEDFDGVDDATLIEESWILTGSATTADNAMRLTDAVDSQAGSVIYNRAFGSELGVNVQFDYYMGGGTGADGLTFFLIDGAVSSPSAGGVGLALGYAYNQDEHQPGASLGYLGLAFDKFGNYVNTQSFHDGLSAGLSANSIAMRGPASVV